ncbi:hypothetical protein J6590_048641 [Homalodisca vitripennis]|nr:hypothetical protein J6590_048641 [Homalodisca vitripennis]
MSIVWEACVQLVRNLSSIARSNVCLHFTIPNGRWSNSLDSRLDFIGRVFHKTVLTHSDYCQSYIRTHRSLTPALCDGLYGSTKAACAAPCTPGVACKARVDELSGALLIVLVKITRPLEDTISSDDEWDDRPPFVLGEHVEFLC